MKRWFTFLLRCLLAALLCAFSIQPQAAATPLDGGQSLHVALRAGQAESSRLFTGQQFDPDLGLYYLRARYHNPDSGRFWTADTFEGFASDPASLHRYTYCQNNPVNCVDPSGYSTSTEALTTTSISLTARIALAGVLSAYSGLVNALDVAVASNFTANSQQLADAYRQGYIAGAVFAGGALSGVGWITGTTTVVGLTLGGLGVGDAIAGGRPDLVITRMTSIAVGVGGAYRLTAALTEFYSRPVSVRPARPPAQPAEEFIDDFHVNSTSEPLPPTARTTPTVFRQGTFADPATAWKGNYVKGPQWATDNPLTTPNFAQKYGLPAQNTGRPDWVVGGRVQGPYTTRPAPSSHNNPLNTGGATEVLPGNPNNVRLDWFHMPD